MEYGTGTCSYNLDELAGVLALEFITINEAAEKFP